MFSNTKTCSKCKIEKPQEAFHKDKKRADGLSCHCKDCKSAYFKKSQKKRKAECPERFLVNAARYRASQKGIPFDITIEDIVIPEFCPILNIRLSSGNRGCPTSPSIDQIVPGKGYTRGNVWVISKRANVIKSDSTPDELLKIANTLLTRFPHLINATDQIQNKPLQKDI